MFIDRIQPPITFYEKYVRNEQMFLSTEGRVQILVQADHTYSTDAVEKKKKMQEHSFK